MAVKRTLIVTDAFWSGLENDSLVDAEIVVDETSVAISSRDSEESVKLQFSRAEWETICEFVKREWAEPTMGGRE